MSNVVGGVITARDREWLAWLGRWRCATAKQLAAWWLPDMASGVKVAEARIRAWRGLGLIWSQRVFSDMPSVHGLRKAGLELAGIGGTRKDLVVGQLRHDLAVVDMACMIRGSRAGIRMLTEREVWAMDPPSSTVLRAAVPAMPGAGRRIIYPDLLTVEESGRVIAHEVELSAKTTPRLVKLMDSYVACPRIARVCYYAEGAARRRVDKAAAGVNQRTRALTGAPEKVFVRGWEWSA